MFYLNFLSYRRGTIFFWTRADKAKLQDSESRKYNGTFKKRSRA